MVSLVLEVLKKPEHLPVARAQVAGISQLSLNQPISGSYALVSPSSDKLGELKVGEKKHYVFLQELIAAHSVISWNYVSSRCLQTY